MEYATVGRVIDSIPGTMLRTITLRFEGSFITTDEARDSASDFDAILARFPLLRDIEVRSSLFLSSEDCRPDNIQAAWPLIAQKTRITITNEAAYHAEYVP